MNLAQWNLAFPKRNAMTPLLWFDALVILPGVPVLAQTSNPKIQSFFMYLIGAAFVLTAVAYAYFAVWAPDRLQSEPYQLSHRAMNMLQEKGGPIPMQPASLNALVNPETLPLKEPAEEPHE
jgi:hypothetical protein